MDTNSVVVTLIYYATLLWGIVLALGAFKLFLRYILNAFNVTFYVSKLYHGYMKLWSQVYIIKPNVLFINFICAKKILILYSIGIM